MAMNVLYGLDRLFLILIFYITFVPESNNAAWKITN